MDRDEKISQIVAISALSPAEAGQYLDFANGDVERAVSLYFENPTLVSSSTAPAPTSTQGNQPHDAITLDSDDEHPYVDDAEFARQLQDAENSRNVEAPIRDPVARRTDVLVDDFAMPVTSVRQATSIWGNSSRLGGLYSLPVPLQITRDIDSAKELGRQQRKHIIVDMQLPSVFDCSCLIRDLWNDQDLLNFVVANFIFVQYSELDGMWESFKSLYMQNESLMGDDAFPYVAVVDSLTGELVHKWVGKQAFPPSPPSQPSRGAMFDAKAFKIELETILSERFSNNHFASLGPVVGNIGMDDLSDSDDSEMDEISIHSIEVQPTSKFDAIPPNDHIQPSSGPGVTSVQVRYPTGERKVRRFGLDEQVQRIYEWLKANPLNDSFVGREFQLLFQGEELIDKLESTIEEARLKMGSIMLILGEAPEEVAL